MAAFPEIDQLIIDDPVSETLVFQTLRSSFGRTPSPQRKAVQLYPTRDFALKIDRVTITQGRVLYAFYLARKGAFEAFSFFHPLSGVYLGEYVGTGDGETLAFNLPSKGASLYEVYIDGAEQTETTHYTITSEGGADGEDLLSFLAAPASGQRITLDFTGQLKVRCTFAEDRLTFETFLSRLVSVGLSLVGELNA